MGCVGSLFYVVVLGVTSSLAIILLKKSELVAILYCGCLCSVSLPHCAIGWSAFCDCGNSYSYPFAFIHLQCS